MAYKTPKTSEKELLESLQNVSLAHGLILRGTQVDFLRLLRTLEQEFPDLYIVFKTSSAGKLWVRRGEEEGVSYDSTNCNRKP